MQPLVQMHQMVPTPPHLEHHHHECIVPYANHLKPEYLALQPQSLRHPRPPNTYPITHGAAPRSFPIRSSQPGPGPGIHQRPSSLLQAGQQGQHDPSEHQLRRKTPSGTIDAGYDGSPAGLATGPPPLKHLILPGSSAIYPTAFVHNSPFNSGGQIPVPTGVWQCAPQLNVSYDSHVGQSRLPGWRSGLIAGPGGLPLSDGTQAHQPSQTPFGHGPRYDASGIFPARVHSVFTPPYQQTMGRTAFNPAELTPPPVWKDTGISDYHGQVPLSNLGFIPQNAAYDAAYTPAQPSMHHPVPIPTGQNLTHGQLMSVPLARYDLSVALSLQPQSAMQASHQGLESLSLSTAAAAAAVPSNLLVNARVRGDAPAPAAGFKERALAHAHRMYTDLLIHLSYTKQTNQCKAVSGSRPPSRMVVFPKPPKQLASALSPRRGSVIPGHAWPESSGPSYSQKQDHHHYSLSQDRRQYNYPVPHGPRSFGPVGPHEAPGVNSHIVNTGSTGLAELFGNGSQPGYTYAGKAFSAGTLNPAEILSPVANAKQSLEILSNLCEQSGWKWVDGMLLGGCLHYGLEHYEEALDWFKRILNLEPSHVEAISNIAATLYCLSRHQEAEQQWRQAVSIKPSYLEAVEHLVGLLCSTQRSEAAVDIISHIQLQLRVNEVQGDRGDTVPAPGLKSHNASSDPSSHPGFGSSGYMIPGSDNGRMLLLVHAKGNMLYALKQVERASEAFEEAVMISIGRRTRGIRSLIRKIHAVLSPRDGAVGHPSIIPPNSPSSPLLLPPEKAKLTAHFLFVASDGQLPGLRYVAEGSHRKSAISTTSNSLLSLAKIFQDSMSNGGAPPNGSEQPSGVGDILALYYLSLSLQESPSTANNVGILLASVQQHSSHVENPSLETAALVKNIPGIAPGSGLALALAYYQYGLSLDSSHVHLHTNLGSLLKDIGQLDMAISMYEQAVKCDGSFDIALTNLANAVKDRGRINDAIVYYKRAVSSNPDFAEAVCGLSTALNSVCDWRGRGGIYLYNGKFDRWHVDESGMLLDAQTHVQSNGLMKRVVDIVAKQLLEASSWGCGMLQQPAVQQMLVSQLIDANASHASPELLASALGRWAGQPWEGSRILRLVERATRATMRRWYVDMYVRGEESPTGYARPRLPGHLTVPSAPTVLPFHTFTCPLTAKDIRMISQRNAHRISCSTLRSPWLPSSVYRPPPPPRPHLNVGYLSSDFNNHPLAHLMQSVFGFHDPSRAKAFCYATTASDRSIHRQQIEREAPVFRDVSSWSSDKLVDQIVRDEIHILVNLNGYTRGARNEVFAARPAPIQMSFMGFAGTLGAEWCDYLLADTTAVPPSTLRPYRDNLTVGDVVRDEADGGGNEWVYSENIIYCRDTFFCCDHAQSADPVDERNMTWEKEQQRRWKMRKELFPSLSDDAIILGNFNQLYKIDPTTFRTWLRILAGLPKAYLWLLRFPELGEINLRRTAKQWAGEEVASRIIFTDVAPKQLHISRARVCDLFLDTPECNAHTTAADVLWSSTPLLTLPRYEFKMCSRMAASILKGALPRTAEGDRAAADLIAANDTQYEEFAIELGKGISYRLTKDGWGEASGRLAELRKLLWSSKWTCALFDTRRWVRDLEDAYDEAWRRWEAGEGGDIYL